MFSKSNSIHNSNTSHWTFWMYLVSYILMIVCWIYHQLIFNWRSFCNNCIMRNPCFICISWRNLCKYAILSKTFRKLLKSKWCCINIIKCCNVLRLILWINEIICLTMFLLCWVYKQKFLDFTIFNIYFLAKSCKFWFTNTWRTWKYKMCFQIQPLLFFIFFKHFTIHLSSLHLRILLYFLLLILSLFLHFRDLCRNASTSNSSKISPWRNL